MSFDSLSDAELIARIGQRDHEAFDALYRRFARRILALAVRRLKDRDSAEDATQDTFVAVWRRAETYRPERGPGAPWLFAIARNAIVDRARARVFAVADVGDAPTDEPGPAEQAERDWLRRRVHAAVEELPQDERTLIELAYWSHLSQSEIAARLGTPLGTVKTGTRRGLARLATLLEHEPAQAVTDARARRALPDGSFSSDCAIPRSGDGAMSRSERGLPRARREGRPVSRAGASGRCW